MDAEQLWETTMNLKTVQCYKYLWKMLKKPDQILDILMGDHV